MGRAVFPALLSLALLATPGCQNRFGQCGQLGGCLSPNCPPTIAPPATGSLNLRGSLANQNYYTPQPNPTIPGGPNSAWNGNGTPNATISATPGQQGWSANPAPGSGSSIAVGSGWNQNLPPSPATAWTVSGNSRVVNPDFSTTQINERNDPSRMPVADASQVRAPAGWNQMPNANRFASATMPTMGNPGLAIPNAVNATGPVWPNGVTQWNFAANNPQPQGTPPQWVLAEASTRDVSRDPNFQAGWRDRGLDPQGNTISR